MYEILGFEFDQCNRIPTEWFGYSSNEERKKIRAQLFEEVEKTITNWSKQFTFSQRIVSFPSALLFTSLFHSSLHFNSRTFLDLLFINSHIICALNIKHWAHSFMFDANKIINNSIQFWIFYNQIFLYMNNYEINVLFLFIAVGW